MVTAVTVAEADIVDIAVKAGAVEQAAIVGSVQRAIVVIAGIVDIAVEADSVGLADIVAVQVLMMPAALAVRAGSVDIVAVQVLMMPVDLVGTVELAVEADTVELVHKDSVVTVDQVVLAELELKVIVV